MQARQLQRRQTYKSRGTRQRAIAARKTVNAVITRALTAPIVHTNASRNAFMRAAYGPKKETGYVDVALATYVLDTTGSVTLLNTVAQGAAVTQRIGKKIIMKGLLCRGNIGNNSAATVNDVAYMIVYDKRPTGALPSVTDILVTANANSMNNDANAGRFRIVKRVDDILLGNSSLTGAVANALVDSTYKTMDWYLDLKSMPVTYKAAGTGAIGDIEEGALYLVTVGNTAAGTSAAVMGAAFRLRFLDI